MDEVASLSTEYHLLRLPGAHGHRVAANGAIVEEPGGWLALLTGVHTGFVEVRTERLRGAPEVVESGWEMVYELSATIGVDPARIGEGMPGAAHESVELTDPGPGSWRLRIHASGRAASFDGGGSSTERYLVQAWPAPSAEPEVIVEDGETWQRLRHLAEGFEQLSGVMPVVTPRRMSYAPRADRPGHTTDTSVLLPPRGP